MATRQEIRGRPAVTHQLVNDYIELCTEPDCNDCRKVMQKASLIVKEAPEWCRKNFELTYYSQHFTLVFWAGSRGNRMVVQAADGKIEIRTTRESWRMWFERVVKKFFSGFKDVAVYFFETALAAASSTVAKALTYV